MLTTNSICSTFAYRLRKGFRASDGQTGSNRVWFLFANHTIMIGSVNATALSLPIPFPGVYQQVQSPDDAID